MAFYLRSMQTILIAIGIYLLYRFVFGFLIPVVKTTRQVKSQFNTMRERMETTQGQPNDDANYQQQNSPKTFSKTTSGKPAPKDDYIEFEEL